MMQAVQIAHLSQLLDNARSTEGWALQKDVRDNFIQGLYIVQMPEQPVDGQSANHKMIAQHTGLLYLAWAFQPV